ncbi:MAG: hypothetical protein WC227_02080 [Patescibacteria group bacterium]|jgi:hypothetical protein
MFKLLWAILAICLISSQALASNAKVADMAMYLSTKVDKNNAQSLRRVAELGYAEENPMKSWQMLQNDFRRIIDSGLPKEMTKEQRQVVQKFIPRISKMVNQYLAAEIIARSKNSEESKVLSKELPIDAVKWRTGLVDMMTEMLKYQDAFPPEDGEKIDPETERDDRNDAIAFMCAEFGLSISKAWTIIGSQQIGLSFFQGAFADTRIMIDKDLKRQYLQKIGFYGVLIDPKISKAAFREATECYGPDDQEDSKEFNDTATFFCSLISLGVTGQITDPSLISGVLLNGKITPSKVKVEEKDLASLIEATKLRAVSESKLDLQLAMVTLPALKSMGKAKEAMGIAKTIIDSAKKIDDEDITVAAIIMCYFVDETFFRKVAKDYMFEEVFDPKNVDYTAAMARHFLESLARCTEGSQSFDDELTKWTKVQIEDRGGTHGDKALELSLLANVSGKKVKAEIDPIVDEMVKYWAENDPDTMEYGFAVLFMTNVGLDNTRAKSYINKIVKKNSDAEDSRLISQICLGFGELITNPIKSLDPFDMGY